MQTCSKEEDNALEGWRRKGGALSLWPRLNLVLQTKYGLNKSKRVKVMTYVRELSNENNIGKQVVILLQLELLDISVVVCFTLSGGIHGVLDT